MNKLIEKAQKAVRLMNVYPELLREVDRADLEKLADLISFELLDRDLEKGGVYYDE